MFYNSSNSTDAICSIGVWDISANTKTIKVNGNYIEDALTMDVDKFPVSSLYPMRSNPDKDVDDIMPVAASGSKVFFRLQDAIDQATLSIEMLQSAERENIVIPAGKKIKLKTKGFPIGVVTNNGSLDISSEEGNAQSSTVINNGTLSLAGNSAASYLVENNGALKITSGEIYDFSKITGNGTISISGGTFSTEPSADMIEKWHTVTTTDNEPAAYKVIKMSLAEAVAAGAVATSKDYGLDYYASISEGLNANGAVYLQKDSAEDVVATDTKQRTHAIYSNEKQFNGTIEILESSGYLDLYGTGFDVKKVTGKKLGVGMWNDKGVVSIHDATLGTLAINASGECTILGGQYINITLNNNYGVESTEPRYSAKHEIRGGEFASDLITLTNSGSRPNTVPSTEEVLLSDYVADGYTIVSGSSSYPYRVVKISDTAAEVVPAAPEVADLQLSGASKEEMDVATQTKDALTNPNTPPTVSADMMTAAANTVANNNQTTVGDGLAALKEQGVADDIVAEEDVTIVVQPYLDIEITDVTIENGTKTLTLDITPMYQKVATTANIENEEIVVKENDQTVDANAVVLEFGELKVAGAVTVEIPLPTNFAADGDLNVGHKGYVYTGTVSKNVLTFTNPHGFSEFTIGVEGAVAKIGDTQYSTLEKAIADAKNGETVIILKDGLTAEMSGDSRTITVKNGTEGKITFKVNGKDYALEKKDDEVQITYTRPSSGGGSVSTYTLTFEVNGGSELKKLTRAYGTTIDLSDYIPTRAGYTFAGWYSDKELTEKVTSIKLNSNTTVYAKWTLNAGGTVAGFTDVKIEDWFAEEVQYVVDKGLMSGTSSTTFAPNGTTTRGMIVAILYRMEKEPTAPASVFTDVKAGAYYEKAIDWAAANEIVKGVSETTFAPDQAITREQLAAILYRYAQFKGYNVSKMNKLDSYADAAQVSPYAVPAMQWANAENLITGKSATILDPKGDATRAEVSSILMRFCENIAK